MNGHRARGYRMMPWPLLMDKYYNRSICLQQMMVPEFKWAACKRVQLQSTDLISNKCDKLRLVGKKMSRPCILYVALISNRCSWRLRSINQSEFLLSFSLSEHVTLSEIIFSLFPHGSVCQLGLVLSKSVIIVGYVWINLTWFLPVNSLNLTSTLKFKDLFSIQGLFLFLYNSYRAKL